MKNTTQQPKIRNGLVQLIRMGKYIRHIAVKQTMGKTGKRTSRWVVWFKHILFDLYYKYIIKEVGSDSKPYKAPNRHFSVTPYITICKSTETYCGLYLRGAMSAVTGIYLFRLLLNIVFFCPEIYFYFNKSCIP